jgi:hypothetical protein
MGQLYSITFKYVPLFNYIISRNCQHIFCIFTCHAYISHNFPTDLSVISKHRCFFFSSRRKGCGTFYYMANIQSDHALYPQSTETIATDAQLKGHLSTLLRSVFSGQENTKGRAKLPQLSTVLRRCIWGSQWKLQIFYSSAICNCEWSALCSGCFIIVPHGMVWEPDLIQWLKEDSLNIYRKMWSAVPYIFINISEEPIIVTFFYPQDRGSRFFWYVSKFMPEYMMIHLTDCSLQVITTRRTSHNYSIWTPDIYSVAIHFTVCTTQKGYPVLSQLHSTGIYSEVFIIKNYLIKIFYLCVSIEAGRAPVLVYWIWYEHIQFVSPLAN